MQYCAAHRATYNRKQQKTPTLNNATGRGKGVDSFVLWSYPIWVQCLNNFVADCRFGWKRAEINGKQGFWPESLLYVLEQNRVFSGPDFASRKLVSSPRLLSSDHSSTTTIRLTRQEIYSDNHRQRNQLGRWVRVDLKTEQGFCCCCCHL